MAGKILHLHLNQEYRYLMKYISLIFFAVILSIGCNNEFSLIADKEEIPVIFGFVSMSDTAQYIRVERAFRDESISAFDLAQIPDSLYYTDAIVSLTNVDTGVESILNRVDGNLEGYPREGGAFATAPNYLYKIKSENIDLIPGDTYRVSVKNADNVELASASTVLGELPDLNNPEEGDLFAFKYDGLTSISWREREDLVLYDINLFINIKERDNSDPNNDFINKKIVWNLVNNVDVEDNGNRYQFPGIDFYSFLLGELEQSEFIDRKFVDIEAELIGAGPELKEYVNVIQANTGITSSGEIPEYTNVENGYGIFSTRSSTLEVDVPLNTKTIDSLVNSVLTRPLNFQF